MEKKPRNKKLLRESLGIEGVNNMVQGGLPESSVIGLSGPPGVGKSILSLHFLLEGARQNQKCVYLNLEEPRKNINNMINEFSFSKEFFQFEKKGLIIIKCLEYSEYEKIYSELLERIKKDKKIKRLVIDSFNGFFSSIEVTNNQQTITSIRRMINESFSHLRRAGLTSILILEKPNEDCAAKEENFNYHIPYLVDGIIKLDFLDLGIIERRIFIPKMRWTNQFKESKNYEISNKGIEIIEED